MVPIIIVTKTLYRIIVYRVVLHGLLLRGVQAQQRRCRTELRVVARRDGSGW